MTAISRIKWRTTARFERIGDQQLPPEIEDFDDGIFPYSDPETAALAKELIARDKSLGIPYPRVKAEISPMIYGGEDYRASYFGYRGRGSVKYADWYRVLAYTTFGHGNWSNNDRRHNGLKPLRTRRKNRRGR